MTIKKLIIGGCLIGASFFVGCQNQGPEEASAEGQEQNKNTTSKETELDMHEASELALLMRDMYQKNLDLRQQIIDGEIPESFPEDFKTIHTADASEELNETYKSLAVQYIANMEAITQAKSPAAGIEAYNSMINTCASCHTIYCQGPLAKIRRMRISSPGAES